MHIAMHRVAEVADPVDAGKATAGNPGDAHNTTISAIIPITSRHAISHRNAVT